MGASWTEIHLSIRLANVRRLNGGAYAASAYAASAEVLGTPHRVALIRARADEINTTVEVSGPEGRYSLHVRRVPRVAGPIFVDQASPSG